VGFAGKSANSFGVDRTIVPALGGVHWELTLLSEETFDFRGVPARPIVLDGVLLLRGELAALLGVVLPLLSADLRPRVDLFNDDMCPKLKSKIYKDI